MPKAQSAAQKAKAKKGMRKKKMADPFLKKDWYVIKVPKYVNPNSGAEEGASWRVGFSPANKSRAKKAIEDRTFVVNLGDLQNEAKSNNFDDLNFKKFKFITQDTFGKLILTQFHGMEITRDKRCSLIRKWHSMMECFCDAKTNDGYTLRVKALAFTKKQNTQIKKNCYAKRTQMKTIRARMREIIKNHVSSTDLKGVVKKLSTPEIGQDIRKSCQLTFPLKTCLIEKVKVMKRPKKDTAKLLEMHDLSIGFDPIKEVAEEDDDVEVGSGAEEEPGDVEEEE
eukprot:CAMPEP_0202691306 /NCGR_PEP_ID=MMETSP1385-20130828/6054_1 /ASSEMBLY_ACC=CAM_ASM_000861 /TAXON_ID=933848 /ORGANISM="Elphidium margaritaceum" /LENGTH=281 /DNA_ID=CAMNT_0049346691 /DNA_START=110 /DNA_END=955 /DNA_ORIENTATION=-